MKRKRKNDESIEEGQPAIIFGVFLLMFIVLPTGSMFIYWFVEFVERFI